MMNRLRKSSRGWDVGGTRDATRSQFFLTRPLIKASGQNEDYYVNASSAAPVSGYLLLTLKSRARSGGPSAYDGLQHTFEFISDDSALSTLRERRFDIVFMIRIDDTIPITNLMNDGDDYDLLFFNRQIPAWHRPPDLTFPEDIY